MNPRDTAQLTVDLLGPLEVRRGSTLVAVTGGRARVVLACLALSAGRPVTAAAVAERVWGARPPQSAEASLASHVTRLRRTLGYAAIRTTASGYVLDLDGEHVDVLRFRRLARRAERSQDPDESRRLLVAALGLWRGEALAGLASESLHRDVAPALAEEHLSALERRIELDLPHPERRAALLAELVDLTGRHPLREPLWRQLLTALAAAGRHADALTAYEQLRIRLRKHVGTDPAAELRELHGRLLDGWRPVERDLPAADGSDPAGAVGDAKQDPYTVRRDLPGDLANFAGRARELGELFAAAPTLDAPAPTVVISAVDGMAGVGKTSLAVYAAHRLAPHYPDGQLFVDLRDRLFGAAGADPATVLDTLLRAIGVAGDRIPEGVEQRSALWRSQLAGRRTLVVLDNAVTAAQVRPLLPGSAGCLALVTSRRRLAELDGAHHVTLDVLPPDDAFALFAGIVGARRAQAEPEATDAVLRRCGHLPLAIRIAAARLAARPAWTIARLAARLGDRRQRLAELATVERSVAAAFAVSYEQLPPGHRRMFRLLGLHRGPDFDAYTAAAAADLGFAAAESVLEDLLDAHLLQQREPGRYEFHDLVRDHARELAERIDGAEERRAVRGRVLGYYLQMADRTDDLIGPGRRRPACAPAGAPRPAPAVADQGAALDWCERELPNVREAVLHAAEDGHPQYVWSLPLNLFYFFLARGGLADTVALYRAALAAAEQGAEPWVRADSLRVLALVYHVTFHAEDAVALQRQALELFREIADEHGEAATLGNLGFTVHTLGRYAEAADLCERAVDLARRIGDRRAEAVNTFNVGNAYMRLGRYEEALEAQKAALALFGRLGDRRMEGAVYGALANIASALRRYDEALDWHRRAVDVMRQVGDADTEAEKLNDLGATCRAAGWPDAAADHYREALECAEHVGNRFHQARAYDGLGHCLAVAQPAAAREHWARALALYEEIGRPEAEGVRAALDASTMRVGCAAWHA